MSSSETEQARSLLAQRLLNAADTAFEYEPATRLHEDFEAVVMEGLLTDRAVPTYPPAGHTYPRH